MTIEIGRGATNPEGILQHKWEKRLKEEGMGEELDPILPGEEHVIGLGVKTQEEEELEDAGGHSATCPLNLGHSIGDTYIDQPNEDKHDE